MDMWVMLEILSPGVQHTQETDLSAEMFRIGGNLQQSCGAGAEQEVVDDLFVPAQQNLWGDSGSGSRPKL